ncbi:MAG: PilN domain-containing protein [Gammaproteobacteria bacterium]
MARINLLPWREELRKDRQRRFLSSAVLALVLTGAGVFGVHTYFNKEIAHQEQRNAFLDDKIKELDIKIAEIKDLETRRKALEDRMKVIRDLQVKRPQIVYLFEQLVQTLPDGTYLTSMSQKANNLALVGKSESNARVSAYMRNIEGSDWLADPRLDVIEAKEIQGARISDFRLNAKQSGPKKPEAEGGS